MDALDRKEELVKAITQAEFDASKIGQNIKELQEQKRVIDKRVKDARQKLLKALVDNGVTKDSTENHLIIVTQGKPQIDIEDIDSVPERFIRTKREVDKAAIKEALASGEYLTGHNWLKFTKPKPSLTIKGKVYELR